MPIAVAGNAPTRRFPISVCWGMVGVRIVLAALWLLAGCLSTPPPPGTRCSLGDPFPAGSPVAIDGSYSVEAARFNPSQSVAYLSLCPASGDKTLCDLYSASFLPATGNFGAYARLGASGPGYDAYPTITPDGQHMLFGSTRNGTVELFVASAVNGSFEMPDIAELDLVPGADYGNEPYMLGDGRTIYFSAGNYDDGNSSQLYRAEGDPPAFGGAMLVPGVNGMDQELAPVVSDDELEIFFASNRAQPGPDMALDIYTATRDRPDEPFGPPALVQSLTTPDIDWPLWLSPDACELYYINKTVPVATLYRSRR